MAQGDCTCVSTMEQHSLGFWRLVIQVTDPDCPTHGDPDVRRTVDYMKKWVREGDK